MKKYGICYARVPLVVVAAFIDCIKWFVFRLCVGKVEMCPNVAVVAGGGGGVDVVDVRFVFWNIIVSNGSLLLRILTICMVYDRSIWMNTTPHYTTLYYTIPLIHWLWKQILKYLKSPHAISVACLLLFSFSFLFDFFFFSPLFVFVYSLLYFLTCPFCLSIESVVVCTIYFLFEFLMILFRLSEPSSKQPQPTDPTHRPTDCPTMLTKF